MTELLPLTQLLHAFINKSDFLWLLKMEVFFVEKAVKDFAKVTENPAQYLEVNQDLVNSLKSNIKEIYDFAKTEELNFQGSNALRNLIVEDFDLEQIWQQIEIQNEEVLPKSISSISRLLINKDALLFENLDNANVDKKCVSDSESESIEEKSNDLKEIDENELASSENESNEETSDRENEEVVPSKQNKNKYSKGSVVDDDFFKLNEMEEFLKKEEKKLADPDSGNDSESDEDEEGSVDLFEAESVDSEEEQDAKMARFKDYFVEKNNGERKVKRNKLMEEIEAEESDDDENEIQNEQLKSSLELRQERLKRKIQEIEDQAVAEKSWQLKGEVTAESRPQNSLLEEIVEFDLTSRPAPVITEQTSLQLEDIIRQRIKDKVFDSVERKIKPIETPLEYRKKLVLDQEKSKQSLAQIYEKEFLDQKAALDPDNVDKDEDEPEPHKEVRLLMMNLFNKLDALSNFHFTSKPAVAELKIVSNLPTVNMEEVAPVAVSDAALLAPEEIKHKPKGNVIGKSERTNADKKRERRKKKLKQKTHSAEKLKKEKSRNAITDGVPRKYGVKGHNSKKK